MRFCQQCTKLEPVSAFEGLKRSCEASLQKRHLRRSGGGAAGRSKSSSSAVPPLPLGPFGYGSLGRGMASGPQAFPPLPLPLPLPPPLPASGTAAGNAAAAAIAAALGAGGMMPKAEDRSSPSSSASLQGRSSSAVAGSNPALAALLEAAADPEAAGLVSIADLPPLASNTKDDSSAPLPLGLQQLSGSMPGGLAGLGLNLGGSAPKHSSSRGAAGGVRWGGAARCRRLRLCNCSCPWCCPVTSPVTSPLDHLARHAFLMSSKCVLAEPLPPRAGFSSWQPPPTWPQPPQSSNHGSSSALASLQAVLAGSSAGSGSAADTCVTLQTFPSGGSSKATVDQSLAAGPAAGAAGQQGQGADVQQLVSALQVLQQLQDAISSLVVAQMRQQPAAQPAAQRPSAQQHLLALLAGIGLPEGQQPRAPPPPRPEPQLPDESNAMLQLLSHLTQQTAGTAGQRPAAPVLSTSSSHAGQAAALQELESQLLKAAAGGGEPDEQQLHALLSRLAGRLQQ